MLTPGEVLRCAVNAISVGFYLLFLATTVKYRQKKPFSGSLFTLCLSIGVIDLFAIAHSYATLRAPNYGIMHRVYMRHDSGWLPAFAVIGAWYAGFAQHWGVLLMTANRLTAICLPFTHESIWATAVKPAIVLQYLVPLVQVAPLFGPRFYYAYQLCETEQAACVNGTDCHLQPRDLTNTSFHPLRVQFEDKNVSKQMFGLMALFSLTINIASLIMYLLMFIALQKNRRKLAPANAANAQSAADRKKSQEYVLEVRLVMAALLISGVLFAYLVWMCLLVVSIVLDSPSFRPADLIFLNHLVMDALATANPFILYFMCAAVRTGMKDLLRSMLMRT